jgi:peptidoglycan/LPS O-acetylase OafA/YrhL
LYFALSGYNPELIYGLTWFRLDGLATGALIAIWARSEYANKHAGIYMTGFTLICAVLLTIGGTPFGLMGTKTAASIALRPTQAYFFYAAFFILTVIYRGSIWTAPLRWRFMQLTGALSYCIYLVHLSVGDGYQYLLRRTGIPVVHYLGASGAVLLRAITVVACSFAIAALSRKYLEEPCLSLKDRFTEPGPLEAPVQTQELVSPS